MEYSCASFDPCKKFARGCLPTQTPTQMLKNGLSTFDSVEIGTSLVSFEIIFEVLELELFTEFKNPKNPFIQPIWSI